MTSFTGTIQSGRIQTIVNNKHGSRTNTALYTDLKNIVQIIITIYMHAGYSQQTKMKNCFHKIDKKVMPTNTIKLWYNV